MKRILFVDDEPNVLAGLQRQLRKHFPVEIAVGPASGLMALQQSKDYAVVVADMRMPEMNGVEFLIKVRQSAPEVVRMMLTGNADQATAIEAINQGNIFRFLNKPCPPETLMEALAAGVRQHELVTAERELLEGTLRGSIKVLTELLAMAEPKAFGQAEMLRDNMRQLAQALNVQETWELEVAAMLSPIAYVTLPPEVALKARIGHPLSGKEQEIFQRLPVIGGNLLAQIPRLERVARIITYQNKCFDGSGLPDDGVAGADIPLGARMLKLLGDLAQSEGKGKTRSAALEELRGRTGWYDPEMLEAVASPLQTALLKKAAPVKPSQPVTFANLRVGHVLCADVETRDGLLIVASGNRVTPALMERLRNFSHLSGIKDPIYVEG